MVSLDMKIGSAGRREKRIRYQTPFKLSSNKACSYSAGIT